MFSRYIRNIGPNRRQVIEKTGTLVLLSGITHAIWFVLFTILDVIEVVTLSIVLIHVHILHKSLLLNINGCR